MHNTLFKKNGIDLHLRKVSRELIKFDTFNEILHYLLESFFARFGCDFVYMILKNNQLLEIKANKGSSKDFESNFPYLRKDCCDHYLTLANCNYNAIDFEVDCSFFDILNDNFPTWFTVPIIESDCKNIGVCVIGYKKVTPLSVHAAKSFEEFGKDLALAIGMAKSKENEKKKIEAIKLLKENVNLGISVEQLVGEVTESAGKLCNAKSAYIYLYDDVKNCFVYQAPSFGLRPEILTINVEDGYFSQHYFPFLEKAGHSEMTIPLIVNLKTIGVLHIVSGNKKIFNQEDIEILQILSSYFSVLIDNARLYKDEKEGKIRLEELMHNNQELVKQTLTGEGFDEITQSFSHMIGRTVILFDRFLRPICQTTVGQNVVELQPILDQFGKEKCNIHTISREKWIKINSQNHIGIWKIIGGGELLGHLGVLINKEELDMIRRMTISNALNVYAIQFIKQKLTVDLKEQAKGGVIHQLFAKKIDDKERLLEYANLFNLNIFLPNKIGVLSINLNLRLTKEKDLLNAEAQKTEIWEKIKRNLLKFNPDTTVTKKDDLFVLIVPEKSEKENQNFWEMLHKRMLNVMTKKNKEFEIFLGISQSTKSIEDYHNCYRQAIQALKIVMNRFPHKGYLLFDSLGSYTVLYNLHDTEDAKLFTKNYLTPLLKYGKGKAKEKELFDTLRVYLMTNGNLKDTSENLFIHRSSLKYRLERIKDILNIDIDNSEERFNLMLAYKLYDLHQG